MKEKLVNIWRWFVIGFVFIQGIGGIAIAVGKSFGEIVLFVGGIIYIFLAVEEIKYHNIDY